MKQTFYKNKRLFSNKENEISFNHDNNKKFKLMFY